MLMNNQNIWKAPDELTLCRLPYVGYGVHLHHIMRTAVLTGLVCAIVEGDAKVEPIKADFVYMML